MPSADIHSLIPIKARVAVLDLRTKAYLTAQVEEFITRHAQDKQQALERLAEDLRCAKRDSRQYPYIAIITGRNVDGTALEGFTVAGTAKEALSMVDTLIGDQIPSRYVGIELGMQVVIEPWSHGLRGVRTADLAGQAIGTYSRTSTGVVVGAGQRELQGIAILDDFEQREWDLMLHKIDAGILDIKDVQIPTLREPQRRPCLPKFTPHAAHQAHSRSTLQ